MALVAASFLAIGVAGAWVAPEPVSGALKWLLMGLLQSIYSALLALSAWLAFGHRKAISYLLCFGVVVSGMTAWNIVAGIDDYRLRLEANDTIATFRDEPLNIVGLAETVERNPYVEAYLVMREAHWELQDRLNGRIDRYRADYENYAGTVSFLAVERMRSRYELWRTFFQVHDLEMLLEAVETPPLETGDLVWTVNLLDVDAVTKKAYRRDLEKSIAEAQAWQSEFIARERQTLRQIRNSLKAVIDAKGRYRFAEGHIVFESPADAAIFSGKDPRND